MGKMWPQRLKPLRLEETGRYLEPRPSRIRNSVALNYPNISFILPSRERSKG